MADSESSLWPEALLRDSAWVRRLALSLVRDEPTADDLTQAVAVQAWRSRPRSPRGWLRAVVRNLARRIEREERRRTRRERVGARRERVDETPERLLQRLELQRELGGYVISLREPCRSTVILRFYEELSSKEIAARCGVSQATVRSRLSRALKQLRVRLDGEFEGGRSAWTALILPFGFCHEVQVGVSGVGAAGAGTKATLGFGVGVMTQKVVIAACSAGAVVLALGITDLFA